jgi:hypothetical protein
VALLHGYEDPPGADDIEPFSRIEHAMMQWIAKKADDNKAVSRTELLTYYIANFGTAVTREWIDSFMFRYTA